MAQPPSEPPRHKVEDISPKLVDLLSAFFASFHNETDDFTRPHLRRAVQQLYPLFVVLYALVALSGVVGNLLVIVTILRNRLQRDPTYYLLLNGAFADLVKCLLVMPITLANLLIQNWIFGRALCYLVPMMQHIPMHVTMLTFVLIALDRYRHLVHVPYMKSSRVPRLLCALGVWVVSACVILPFLVYIQYVDLRPEIEAGLCMSNIDDTMEEYARGLFIALYVLPLATVAFLQLRIAGEIKNREGGPLSAVLAVNGRRRRTQHLVAGSDVDVSMDGGSVATVVSSSGGNDTPCPTRSAWRSSGGDEPVPPSPSTTVTTVPGSTSPPSSISGGVKSFNRHPLHNSSSLVKKNKKKGSSTSTPLEEDDEFQTVELHWRPLATTTMEPEVSAVTEDVDDEDDPVCDPRLERRTQNYLIAMVTAFAVCLAPLEVMRLVRIVIIEDLENSAVFDISFLVIVLLSYVPTCITPALFVGWMMAGRGKLGGYFQFGGGVQRQRLQATSTQSTFNGNGHSNINQHNLKLHIQKPANNFK